MKVLTLYFISKMCPATDSPVLSLQIPPKGNTYIQKKKKRMSIPDHVCQSTRWEERRSQTRHIKKIPLQIKQDLTISGNGTTSSRLQGGGRERARSGERAAASPRLPEQHRSLKPVSREEKTAAWSRNRNSETTDCDSTSNNQLAETDQRDISNYILFQGCNSFHSISQWRFRPGGEKKMGSGGGDSYDQLIQFDLSRSE
ncbi:hypothetical protein chiPu_0009749 [Chiloscyllium punctatum]|uniref:Uncharacterized protein n=1 Tax=Chiloscyllium punctatum TaxID=137246 RepID=A0A401SLM7_CHIPU|nr:hypothetical protein [Chiloscyllium punctatum]